MTQFIQAYMGQQYQQVLWNVIGYIKKSDKWRNVTQTDW